MRRHGDVVLREYPLPLRPDTFHGQRALPPRRIQMQSDFFVRNLTEPPRIALNKQSLRQFLISEQLALSEFRNQNQNGDCHKATNLLHLPTHTFESE